MTAFNPYLAWLGIPAHEQPPNFYRLLGIVLFESNPQVVEQAADRQSLRVGAHRSGPQGEHCQQLLSEIAMARFNLLDPQQKASYDAHIQEELAHRGERAVSAPPPPALFGGMNPAMAMPPGQRHGETAVRSPGPPPSQQPPMPRPAMPQHPMPTMAKPQSVGIPMPQAPARPMPQAVNFGPPMAAPRPVPIAIPVAAPFPTAAAMQAAGNGAATATIAPPTTPPAPPERPMDEIENLSAQPSRRRYAKKKAKKKDYTKEFVIGGIVAVFGGLLLIVFLAVQSQDHSQHGFNAIDPEKSQAEEADKALTSAKAAVAKEKEKKDIEKKDKESEKKDSEKKVADADHSSQNSSLRSMDDAPKRHRKHQRAADTASSSEGEFTIRAPAKPDAAPPDNHAADTNDSAPAPDGHDTPRDLGGDNDPVMELTPPDQPAPKPDQ